MSLSENNRINNKTFPMQFSLISLPYLIFLLSCGNSNTNPKHLSIDSVFVSWNKSTLSSLNNHIISATDSSEKSLYKNRLLAFKSFIDIDGDNDVNTESIRYQFLKMISLDVAGDNFAIIEANSSGEVVELRNYLITPDKKNIDVYNFIDRQWVKSKTEKVALSVSNNLNSYFTKFGSGVNQDDVIVTSFNKEEVDASEYYLFTTLSKSNPWEKVLLLK